MNNIHSKIWEYPSCFLDMYGPVNFSNILDPPHKVLDVEPRETPKFHGNGDSGLVHVATFVKFVGDNGIFYEDDMMR